MSATPSSVSTSAATLKPGLGFATQHTTKSGQHFMLRRPRVSDAADVCEYIGATEVHSNLLQLPYPSVEMWEERLKNPPAGSFSLAAEMQLGSGPKVVALAGVFPDSGGQRRAHVRHLGMSIAAPYHGQGIGNALMFELLRYADDWAQCFRLELEVFTDNTAAIALYKKHGFQIEGTKRADSLRAGQYVNSHTMGRLNPNAAGMLKAFA
jgi:L-phenylalanine/L-methionine N-acetyltransferase